MASFLQNLSNTTKKLLSNYQLGIVTKPNSGYKLGELVPTHADPKNPNKRIENKYEGRAKENFRFFKQTTDLFLEDYKNRVALYEDVDWQYYHTVMVARATDIFPDEIFQSDTSEQFLKVEGDKNQVKIVQDLLDKWQIVQSTEYATMHDCVHYGNGYQMPEITTNGIEGFIFIDPYDVEARFEFSPYNIDKIKKNMYGNLNSFLFANNKLKALADSIINDTEFSYIFKQYLFGFQVGDYMVPPWRLSHFRNFTTKSPFTPFGIPEFIHCLAPSKKYHAGQILENSLRAANFPRDIFEVDLPPDMPRTQKLLAMADMVNQYKSMLQDNSSKEDIRNGDELFTIKGLIEYSQEGGNIQLGRSDVTEQSRDDIIMGVGLPRELLDPNSNGFGDSGVAFAQKNIFLKRKIRKYQTEYLRQRMRDLQLHCAITNVIPLQELDITLSMPFPESQNSRDYVSSQRDQISLAKDLIASLNDTLVGGRDALPPLEVVRNIFTKMLPYDPQFVEENIDLYVKQQKQNEKEMEETLPPKIKEAYEKTKKTSKEDWSSLYYNKNSRHKVEALVDKLVFYTKFDKKESIFEGRHYLGSNYIDPKFPWKHILDQPSVDKTKLKRIRGEVKKNLTNPDPNEKVMVGEMYEKSQDYVQKFKSKNDRGKYATYRYSS